MKYDDTTANSVKSVLYGQNMLVLFIVMSLIRSTLDTIFVGKGGEKNMEAYFCVVLVVSALVIQIMSIGYIYADEKHLAGENDALMITLMILNLAIILSLFIIVYFSRIFSTQDMKKYGLEVHWNIWTVILFQVIIDIPLITGFTFLGSGLLMQYGVQDYLSIITTRGVFVVFGFIAHIAHVLKHLQYRFEESYKYKKDKEIEARKPGMHGTEGMNVIDIFNWITNTRLFASVVVVVGGFILFFAAREDSLNGSAIIELNQRQYMYLCILFVLINVGYEFYHETRAYYLLYINETLKEQKTSEVSENIYKIPRYGDGTSAKSLIIVIFLAISHFMAFSLYWKV